MLLPRQGVIDIEHSESSGEASMRPASGLASADNLRDRLTLAGRKQDRHVQESVIKNNVERPSRDGGQPRSAPIFFIGSHDDNLKTDADIQKPAADSTLAENFQDRFTVAGREEDNHVQESVIESNAVPTRDEGQPRLAPIFFIGSGDDNTNSDTDTRKDSMMEEDTRFCQLGSSADFLQNCAQCKKKLPEKANLYMYGYNPGAFCSIDCRRKRMELDGYHIKVGTASDDGNHMKDKQKVATTLDEDHIEDKRNRCIRCHLW